MKNMREWYLRRLRLIIDRDDLTLPLPTLRGLQVAVPHTRLNGVVCIERLQKSGLMLGQVAERLDMTPDDLLSKINELPDEGWYIGYCGQADEGRLTKEALHKVWDECGPAKLGPPSLDKVWEQSFYQEKLLADLVEFSEAAEESLDAAEEALTLQAKQIQDLHRRVKELEGRTERQNV